MCLSTREDLAADPLTAHPSLRSDSPSPPYRGDGAGGASPPPEPSTSWRSHDVGRSVFAGAASGRGAGDDGGAGGGRAGAQREAQRRMSFSASAHRGDALWLAGWRRTPEGVATGAPEGTCGLDTDGQPHDRVRTPSRVLSAALVEPDFCGTPARRGLALRRRRIS